MGMNILEFTDWFIDSILMPIAAIATCIVVGWVAKPDFIIKEVRLSAKFRGAKI